MGQEIGQKKSGKKIGQINRTKHQTKNWTKEVICVTDPKGVFPF